MTSLKRMRPLLGTYIEIGAEGSGSKAETAISAAFGVVETLHSLLSFHEEASDLTRLNQSAGAAVKVHPHTIRALKLARGMTEASKGLFNCTIGGAMVQLNVLPEHGGQDILLCGDVGDIQINGAYVSLKRPIKITLDGIAKGYAVDCAIMALKRNGVSAGWVNAGGDLRVFGNTILQVERREVDGSMMALGGLQNAALASSRVTRQQDEAFPGYIVGNSSPAEGVWSVMAHQAWRADALTKVASLAADSERDAIVARLGGMVVSPQQNAH